MTCENKLIGKREKIMGLIVTDFQEILLQRGIKKEYIYVSSFLNYKLTTFSTKKIK